MPDRLPAGIAAIITDATNRQTAVDTVATAVYAWLDGYITGDRLTEIAIHHRSQVRPGEDLGARLAWPEHAVPPDLAPGEGIDYLTDPTPVAVKPTNPGRHQTVGAYSTSGRAA